MLRNVNQKTGQPIYHLIAILEDAKKGYLNASDKTKDEVLSLLFENFSYQKLRYMNELKELVNRIGVPSVIDQFTLSLLHRTWLDLKNAFRFGQREAVLKACIKGEETMLKDYFTALEQIHHDDEIKLVLLQQVSGIKTVLNTIKAYNAKAYS